MGSPETSPEPASFKVTYGTRQSPGRPRFGLLGTLSFGPNEAALEQGTIRGIPQDLMLAFSGGCLVLVLQIVVVVSSQHNSLWGVLEDVGKAGVVCGIAIMALGGLSVVIVSGGMNLLGVPRHRFVLARGTVYAKFDSQKGVLGFQAPDGPYVTVKLKQAGFSVSDNQRDAFRDCIEGFFTGHIGPLRY